MPAFCTWSQTVFLYSHVSNPFNAPILWSKLMICMKCSHMCQKDNKLPGHVKYVWAIHTCLCVTYIFTHTHTCTHTHTHTHTNTHTTHTHTHPYMHTRTHTHTRTYTHISCCFVTRATLTIVCILLPCRPAQNQRFNCLFTNYNQLKYLNDVADSPHNGISVLRSHWPINACLLKRHLSAI